MRLSELLRTSSFRLSLLYAWLTLACFGLLFGGVLLTAGGFMTGQIDQTVSNEIGEILTTARTEQGGDVRATVARMTRESPGIDYLLEDPDGAWLAGNLPPMAPRAGIYDVYARHRQAVHGHGVILEDGEFLFVGVSRFALDALERGLARAFLIGGGLALLLALAGGVWMSARLLRRVEHFNRVGRAFIGGAFGQRIPLRGTRDEFDRLGASLNEMFAQTQALMSGLQQVSSDIAHDLRTPLGRLRQSLERALTQGGGEEAYRAALASAIGETDEILGTFNALLRIAQIEAGTRRVGFSEVDLTELLRSLLETYQVEADSRGQKLDGWAEDGLRVEGDRQLLMQLFVNLLDNALTHCPRGACIRMQAMREGTRVRVEISDDGPGIPEPLLKKVFQRFFRVDPSRHETGNGLGLTLAAAVTALHQGEIGLRNLHPGLEVTVSLPER